MTASVAARFEVRDPGFVRTRGGVRTACATVLAWATMVAVTSIFSVADPLRITLFGAGTSFLTALLVTDPQRRDRVRTLGWSSVVVAVALVATINLRQIAVWAVAALLVLLMFLSFALRSRSPRAGSLAAIGALTTLMASAGHITMDRIGWFVLASTVGIGWLAVWQLLILPDDPVGSLTRSVQAFCRRAAETVANIAVALTTTRARDTPDRAGKALRRSLDRVRSCRTVIDNELTGALYRTAWANTTSNNCAWRCTARKEDLNRWPPRSTKQAGLRRSPMTSPGLSRAAWRHSPRPCETTSTRRQWKPSPPTPSYCATTFTR